MTTAAKIKRTLVYAAMLASVLMTLLWTFIPQDVFYNVRELDGDYRRWHRNLKVWYQTHPPGHPPPGVQDTRAFENHFWVRVSSFLWLGPEKYCTLLFLCFLAPFIVYRLLYYHTTAGHFIFLMSACVLIFIWGCICLFIDLTSQASHNWHWTN